MKEVQYREYIVREGKVITSQAVEGEYPMNDHNRTLREVTLSPENTTLCHSKPDHETVPTKSSKASTSTNDCRVSVSWSPRRPRSNPTGPFGFHTDIQVASREDTNEPCPCVVLLRTSGRFEAQ